MTDVSRSWVGVGHRSHLQRGTYPYPRRSRAFGRRIPTSTSSWSTTTAPTGPGTLPMNSPCRTSTSTSSIGPGKAGLGAAYIAGFRWGLGRDYEVLVEMDADGSHRVEHLGQTRSMRSKTTTW